MRTHTIALTILGALTLTLAGCGDLSQGGVISVGYTPDNHLVAFLGGEVRVYDRDGHNISRKIVTRVQEDGYFQFSARLVLSKDGTRVAIGVHREVDVHDVSTGARVAPPLLVEDDVTVTSSIVGLALSPSGELLACAVDPITSGTPHLDVWRVADGKRVVAIAMTPGAGPGSSWGADLAFSADARVLYGIENVNSASGASGKQFVTAWNVTDGSTLWRSELPPELYHGPSEGIPAPFSSLALSPDGSTLATGSVEVLLWHAADGTRVAGFQTPQQNVSAQVIAFSADGRSLATTYAINEVDKNAIVFGPTGAIAQSWPVEGGGCEGISFSPDGQRLAAACSDGLLEIWNPTNGDVVTRAKATTTLY